MLRIAEIPMPLDFTEKELRRQTARRLKVPESALGEVRLYRKSVDARKKNDVHFTCTVEAQVDGEKKVLSRLRDSKIQLAQPYEYRLPSSEPLSQRPVIAGFGPAGLFAALILAQAGQKPIVLERGAPVDERSRTVEHAEAAFLSSSSHRITLMGRQWTRMGVGVATTPEGFVYVVQIFVR